MCMFVCMSDYIGTYVHDTFIHIVCVYVCLCVCTMCIFVCLCLLYVSSSTSHNVHEAREQLSVVCFLLPSLSGFSGMPGL